MSRESISSSYSKLPKYWLCGCKCTDQLAYYKYAGICNIYIFDLWENKDGKTPQLSAWCKYWTLLYHRNSLSSFLQGQSNEIF